MAIKQKPAKPGYNLRILRNAMARATAKFMDGGRANPNRKPVTLRLPKQPTTN